MRPIYSLLFLALLPFVVGRLYYKGRLLPGYRQRIGERFGRYRLSPPAVSPIWIHAVSVGECEAAFPLIRKLRFEQPDIPILMTCTTPTGSSRIASVLGNSVMHVYLPYDLSWIAQRFFTFFKPRLGIIMETEIWPNLFVVAKKMGIPLMIANGRLSVRSTRGYQRMSALIKPALSAVRCIAAQSEADAERYRSISTNPSYVVNSGNIKYDISWSQEQAEAALQLRSYDLSGRKVIVAGSTHPGEEEEVLSAFRTVRQRFPDALLILVPRHPERGRGVHDLCISEGFVSHLFSVSPSVTNQDEILIIDKIGELRRFYGASDVSFIGGSLIPHGGQNPLEPLVARVPVLFGPYMSNFTEIRQKILNANAGMEVRSADELAAQIISLLCDPILAKAMGKRGEQMVCQNQGAVSRIYDLTAGLLHQSSSLSTRPN